MSKRFKRTDSNRYLKLGKNKRSSIVWRRAKGIHSKIRKRRAGYPSIPTIGHGSAKKAYGKIGGLNPILVNNPAELNLAGKNSIIIIARKVGAKKRLEIIKKAEEMKLKLNNIGAKK